MSERKLKKARGNEFQIGDLVWARVKSYPWWPGMVFNQAFASPSVFKTKKEGYLLVSFFGDSTYKWFTPASLRPFDSQSGSKLEQTKTASFKLAAEDVVAEVKRRAALGLACRCRNPSLFQSTNVQGFLKVNVSGYEYEPEGLYSIDQIRRAREAFEPEKTLSFVQELALAPGIDMKSDLNHMENVAKVLAYRKAVFSEFDKTYAQAFAVEPEYAQASAIEPEFAQAFAVEPENTFAASNKEEEMSRQGTPLVCYLSFTFYDSCASI